MVTFGIVLTTLGATLPSVIDRFGIDKRQAGALLALLSLGVLAGALIFGPIVDRRGYRGVFLFAFASIAIGLEGIAFAPSLAWLRTFVLLVGLTGGMLNGGTSALVADVSAGQRSGALAFVSAFFGVGAAGVPFLLAAFAGRFSQSAMLAAIGAFVWVPFVLAAVTTFPLPKHAEAFPVADARRLLRDPVLLLIGFMLFIESGAESIVGGWTPTYFAEELTVSLARAPMYLALFWLGLMLARLGMGVVMKTSGISVLRVTIAVAFASTVLLIATHGAALGGLAVFLLGGAFAPAFPVLLGFVADRYAHISGTAMSVAFTIALTGGMLLPYLTGVIASARGLRVAFVLLPFGLVVMAALLAALSRQAPTARQPA